jgi:hypothetical protein
MKKRLVFTLALVPVIYSAIVLGASSAISGPSLDRNEDGFISLDEARENVKLSTLFADLDMDKDGLLSVAELAKFEAIYGELMAIEED